MSSSTNNVANVAPAAAFVGAVAPNFAAPGAPIAALAAGIVSAAFAT